MGFTGHQNLANQLLPTPAALQDEVQRFARAELLPMGWQILARHIDRRFNVRRGTFANATIPRLSGTRDRPAMSWLIDHPGADIQDRGGTIKAKRFGQRMVFRIPGIGWRTAREVTLTGRHYLSPALTDITQQTTRRLEGHLAAWIGGRR